MSETLTVKKRDRFGTKSARRLREEGSIPAVVYGHKEETISITVDEHDMMAVLRHNAHLVDLEGDFKDKALIKDIQWDTYGQEVLHVDFTRVSADERIQVELQIELRGVAPGTNDGGVLEQLVHEVELECAASNIPEKLEININDLELNGAMTIADIELDDPSIKILLPEDTVVVQCNEPQAEIDEEQIEAGGAEPEVIGRKPEDEEDSED